MNKVVLLTGASSGIGKATAKELLREGHTVYGAARKVEEMAELEKMGAQIIRLDVTKESECKACCKQILEEQGRIDVLINNAGFGLYGAIEDISMRDVKYQFDVNVLGMARMIKNVLPQMRLQQAGKIINVSSIAGKMYSPLAGWYHATKHAIEGLSDCLRLEVKEYGIDVVIIEPGLIKTNFYAGALEQINKNSALGAYGGIAQSVTETLEKVMQAEGLFSGSPPEIVAKTMSRAVNSENPRTRYVTGKMGRLSIMGRKLLPDKVFDKFIMRSMAPKAKEYQLEEEQELVPLTGE